MDQYTKYLVVLLITGIMMLSVASASLIHSYASLSGTAEVETPLEIEEVYYNSNITGQDYGEYIILDVGKSTHSSDWNLTSDESGENVINFSEELDPGLVALVDNKSAVQNADIDLYEVVTITESGLSDSGELLDLSYVPTAQNLQKVNYTGSSCDDSSAYNASTGNCEDAYLEVSP